MRGQEAGGDRLAAAPGAAHAAQPRWLAWPAALGAWLWRWLPLPTPLFLISALLTCGVVWAWDVYLLGNRQQDLLRQLLQGLALIVAVALTCERYRPRVPDLGALVRARRRLAEAGLTALLTLALLGAGLRYRLMEWPALRYGGDSGDYERMATAGAAAHQFVLLPWRTPGYAFP
ncbi:MAG TPA: hypothetical protein VOB72_10470, partial [Candidatus Dormibacteraeota bacterium]|nr:hypothetical protein [Candidatus Dormibacteraeota bacterium]